MPIFATFFNLYSNGFFRTRENPTTPVIIDKQDRKNVIISVKHKLSLNQPPYNGEGTMRIDIIPDNMDV